MVIIDGVVIEYYKNGRVYAIYELDDRRRYHGTYRTWFETGQKRSIMHYHHGKGHGIYHFWFANGILSETFTYANNLRHGLATTYFIDGALKDTKYYYHADDITNYIKPLVKDIANITDQEKTHIAVQFGFEL